MKKLLILAVLFFVKSSTDAFAQRQLTLINANTCGASISFSVSAIDAGSSGCPSRTFTTTLLNNNVFGGERITDFDAAGAGPGYWDAGGTIGSSPSWGFAQVGWSGAGGVNVGSTTGSFTCFTVSNTGSIPGPGCTVNVTWTEDAFGNVKIKAN